MPHVVRAALGGITVLQKFSYPFLSPDLPTSAYSKYCMYCKPDLYEEAWYWFDVASKPKSTESARTFLLRFSSVTPITARLDLITCAVGFIVTVVSRLAAAGTLVQKAAFVGMLELLPNSHQNKKKKVQWASPHSVCGHHSWHCLFHKGLLCGTSLSSIC